MKIQQPHKKISKWLITLVVIILLVAGYIIYAKASSIWPFAPAKSNVSDNRSDTDTPKKSGENSNSGDANRIKGDQNSGDSAEKANANVKPKKPSGTFVSNHHPNLSGSPAPNRMASTCNTSPGVMCSIRFMSGDVVRSLPAKMTNQSGNTTWNWKLQDIGLTKGTWQITAIAKNGNKTVETTDPMSLIVEN